eukprot:scaffold23.g4192.t1
MGRIDTLTEEEELELAQALSAADAVLKRSPSKQQAAQPVHATSISPASNLDEAVARELQQQEYLRHSAVPHQQAAPHRHCPDAGVPSWVVPDPQPALRTQPSAVEGFKVSMREAGAALNRLGSSVKQWVDKHTAPPGADGNGHHMQQRPQQRWQAAAAAAPQPRAPPCAAPDGAVPAGWAAPPPPPPAGAAPAQQWQQAVQDEAMAQQWQQAVQDEVMAQQWQQAVQDEALARQLQEQYDREQAEALARQEAGQQHHQRPQLPQQQRRPPAPPPAAEAADAAGGRGGAAPPGGTQLALPVDAGACAGCGKPLFSLGSLFGARSAYMTALGRSWHPACFRCTYCARAIEGSSGGRHGGPARFAVGAADGLPYHLACHRAAFHPRCAVCADWVPAAADGSVAWSEVPFWGDRFCPGHAADGTPRCAACTRLRPADARPGGPCEWASLEDGRVLCLSCMDTVVAGDDEGQALFTQAGGSAGGGAGGRPRAHAPRHGVIQFFTHIGLGLPTRPPMMLVEARVLAEVEARETGGAGRGDGPVFHTRGLCLTEEYTTLRTVLRAPGGLLRPWAVREEVVAAGPTTAVVKAILVSAARPCVRGLATDPSPVYGDGFRRAHDAFQRVSCSMQLVLSIVRETGTLPAHA